MARPQKNSVGYFPHNVKHGKKMSYIEKKYKNDGYATWFKILEELGDADNHYLNLGDTVQLMFLSDRCNISESLLQEIINDLVKLGEFNPMLWNENKIIWCDKFIGSIEDAYSKRKNKCITFEGLLHLLVSLGVRKPLKSTLKGDENTQTKEEYTKLDEIKEDKIKLNKSLMSEIKISDLEKNEVEYFEIADAFRKLFIKNLNEKNAPVAAQEKAKYKSYVDPIRLMMCSDKVTKEQLTTVFRYLGSPEGDFWKPNILSTSKLREKFSQLIIKSQSQNGNGYHNHRKSDSELKQSASNAVDKMFSGQ